MEGTDIVVSIIVPTFNRAKLIADTIRSVQQQTFQQWELLVIDDGSSDDTTSVVGEFMRDDHRIHLYQRPVNQPKGANTCRNYGLQLAHGAMIKWLDSDDILDSRCLEKQVVVMRDPAIDVCFSQTGYFVAVDDVITKIEGKVWGDLKPRHSMVDEYLSGKLRWQTGSGLWKRSYVGTEPYKIGLMNSQEWLMHFKYLLRHPSIFYLDEPLCLARKHMGSMSDAKHKRSVYYYNQCAARLEAVRFLANSQERSVARVVTLSRAFFWNHLFVFYKGGILRGFQLFPKYFDLLYYVAKTAL